MKSEFTAYWDGETLEIQRASYIEDGWIIRTGSDGMFEVYEIPQYGGDEHFVGKYATFKEAKHASETLT